MKWPLKQAWAWIGIIASIIMAAAAGRIMSRVEQPAYKVMLSEGAFEVREYGPMIAAEVEVKGERKAAMNEVGEDVRNLHRMAFDRPPNAFSCSL